MYEGGGTGLVLGRGGMNDEINVLNVSACWSIQRAGAGWCPPDCVGTRGHISLVPPSLSSLSLPRVGSQPPWLSAASPTPSAGDPPRSCSPFTLPLHPITAVSAGQGW